MKEFAASIVHTLRQNGFQAYLVGGCVRDLLLGRAAKDYDVATNATPERVMSIFPETYAVGAQFGVVLVPLPDGERLEANSGVRTASEVEVATFRSDIGYSDGRHPDQVRRCAARLHNQRNAARSGQRRGARFCGRAERPGERDHPRDRRPGAAVCRR
jgi:tRNA nucleotidyltransferase/poly(A) polymerase